MYNNYFWVKKKLFPEEIVSSTTVFNINNKKKSSLAPNQHIRMISERSCDTEDCNNYC